MIDISAVAKGACNDKLIMYTFFFFLNKRKVNGKK